MLSIINLCYTTNNGKTILNNFNADIPKNHFTTIIGANGAGKSTLLKCICKELLYQHGDIFWVQNNLKNLSLLEMSQSIAILRQQNNIQLPFTAKAIIEMAAIRKNNTHNNITNTINEIAELVGVKQFLLRNYQELSGGEQQRVQLVRVLLQLWLSNHQDKLLLLDEPVSALDIQYQHQFMELMQYLVKEKKITIISILHDINLAAQYVDEVVLLKNGINLAQGKPKDVFTSENLETIYNIPFQIEINDLEQIKINVPKLQTRFFPTT